MPFAMRMSLILLALAPAPALAQPLPKANALPPTGFVTDADLDQQIAAASAFPLGSLQNPVRVGGPVAEQAYIGRLRCADGKIPAQRSKAPGGVGPYGSVLEAVTLDCGASAPGKAVLMFDIYQEEHSETRAAAGFSAARP
jgi:hypothetical protein